jgi:TIR domain
MTSVFLSYASEENGKPDDPVSRGWVTAFVQSFKLELRPGLELWFDQRDFNLPGIVRDKLLKAIQSADFLLPVLSGYYSTKDYTQFELIEFFKAIAAKGGVPTDYVIPILPRPVTDDDIPPPLSNSKWVAFFDTDPATGRILPYFEGFGREISPKYWTAIRDIVAMIMQQIALQRPPPPSATVYLALPAMDQIDNHWSMRNELLSQKCRVLPKPRLPVSTAAARMSLSDALKEAQFSIHLLGATPGEDRSAGLAGLAATQLDMAAERQRRDTTFRRLIWIPSDLQPTDDAQKQLIASLDSGERLTERAELVRGGIEAFKEIIHDELVHAQAHGAAAQPQQAGSP